MQFQELPDAFATTYILSMRHSGLWIIKASRCEQKISDFARNLAQFFHYVEKTSPNFTTYIIWCKLHYLNLFMNHLKFNVSFDFFTTILSVLFTLRQCGQVNLTNPTRIVTLRAKPKRLNLILDPEGPTRPKNGLGLNLVY